MHVKDISIAKYIGFCCLEKFNLFPKIEYVHILYLFSKCATIVSQNTRSVFDNKIISIRIIKCMNICKLFGELYHFIVSFLKK